MKITEKDLKESKVEDLVNLFFDIEIYLDGKRDEVYKFFNRLLYIMKFKEFQINYPSGMFDNNDVTYIKLNIRNIYFHNHKLGKKRDYKINKLNEIFTNINNALGLGITQNKEFESFLEDKKGVPRNTTIFNKRKLKESSYIRSIVLEIPLYTYDKLAQLMEMDDDDLQLWLRLNVW